MSQSEDVLVVERTGSVLRLTVNRPERRNALTGQVFALLQDALLAGEGDAGVGAVILTGAGDKAFSAGADLKPDTEYSPLVMGRHELDHPIVSLYRVVERCTKPLIARVNGDTMAGGMGLLAMCDLGVAADDARFALPEARIGLFPLLILTYLRAIVPHRQLMELCMTGEPFDAARALQAGLVNYVVPRRELDAKTDWLIERVLANSPAALRRGKHAMRHMSLDESFAFAQTEVAAMFGTPDFAEGIAAFNEKRKPRWPD